MVHVFTNMFFCFDILRNLEIQAKQKTMNSEVKG